MDIKTEQEISRKLNQIVGEEILKAVAKILSKVEKGIIDGIKPAGEPSILSIEDKSMNKLFLNSSGKEIFEIWKRNLQEISITCDFKPNFPTSENIQGFISIPGRPIVLPPIKEFMGTSDRKIMGTSDRKIMGTHEFTINLGIVKYKGTF